MPITPTAALTWYAFLPSFEDNREFAFLPCETTHARDHTQPAFD